MSVVFEGSLAGEEANSCCGGCRSDSGEMGRISLLWLDALWTVPGITLFVPSGAAVGIDLRVVGIDFSIASAVGITLSAWVVGIALRGAGEVRGIIFRGEDVVGIVLRVGEGFVVGIIFSGPELCCCCGLLPLRC